jgi:hypothetical protein
VQISGRVAACGVLICCFICGLGPIPVPSLGSATTVQGVGGSLVVVVWSKKGDYVVVAAESRRTDLQGRPVTNTACKVIGLGGATLFFVTGRGDLQVDEDHHTVRSWDGERLAHRIYQKSGGRYPDYLSDEWTSETFSWLKESQKQGDALSQMAYSDTGEIAEAGFIGPGSDRPITVKTSGIYYSMADDKIVLKPPPPSSPGAISFFGAGQDLAKKYLNTHSLSFGLDPTVDEDFAKRMVQFAIDNSTGPDHDLLGGDIDVALLQNGQITWKDRKGNCSALDQK